MGRKLLKFDWQVINLLVILTCCFTTWAKDLRSISYDQRQDGKVNVMIDVKDLQIVALVDSGTLDDYTNYDYAYDYADFTIKPRPTPKPTTTGFGITSNGVAPTTTLINNSTTIATSTSTTTTTTTPAVVVLPTGNLIGNSTILVIPLKTNENDTDQIENKNDKLSTESVINDNEKNNTTTTTTIRIDVVSLPQATVIEPRKRCPIGFILKSNKCFKRRLSFIS